MSWSTATSDCLQPPCTASLPEARPPLLDLVQRQGSRGCQRTSSHRNGSTYFHRKPSALSLTCIIPIVRKLPHQPHHYRTGRCRTRSIHGCRSHPALDLTVFQPHGRHTEERRQRPDHGELPEAQRHKITRLTPHPPRRRCPRLSGQMTPLLFVRPCVFVAPNHHRQGYHPLTAFCTRTRLFEWFVMPQGSSAAPG